MEKEQEYKGEPAPNKLGSKMDEKEMNIDNPVKISSLLPEDIEWKYRSKYHFYNYLLILLLKINNLHFKDISLKCPSCDTTIDDAIDIKFNYSEMMGNAVLDGEHVTWLCPVCNNPFFSFPFKYKIKDGNELEDVLDIIRLREERKRIDTTENEILILQRRGSR